MIVRARSLSGVADPKTARNRFTDLVMLIADLHAGCEIQSSRIKDLLTPAEWYRFRLLMHGPVVPGSPTRDTLNRLHAYRQQLKKADNQYRAANARKRDKSMIGPDLFRQAEAAYAKALETLEELLQDHLDLAHYLSPFPDFSARSSSPVSATKEGMPRLTNTIEERSHVYSLKGGEACVETAVDILRGIARRELERFNRRRTFTVAPSTD